MKKFFSLVCALAIVLSASAVPAKTLGKDLKLDAKELKAAPVKTVKMANQLQKAEKASAFFAPQAKKETFNLTADEYESKFYTTDNDVWVKLYVGDEYVFYFDVVVAEGLQDLAVGTTYTLTDMLENYTYVKDATTGDRSNFTAASITKTYVSYEEQQLVRFEATATTVDGDIYNVVYEEAPFIITGDTIDVFFTQSMNKPIFAENLAQVRTQEGDNDAAFCFTVATEGSIVGTFTNDDMNLEYTFVNQMYAKEAHCVITETAGGHIDLEGWILATDGNVYHITMFFDVPTPQSQVNITATNLALDDSYAAWFGVIFADASNEDYSISITFMGESTSALPGTYAIEDLYAIALQDANGNKIEIYSGSITVAVSNGDLVITGTLLGMNSVEYTINLSYVLPEPTSFETLNGAGLLYLLEQDDMYYWQAVAMNADQTRYVSLLAITDGNDAGTYSASDLYASYTYAGKFIGTDTTWYEMVDANIVLTINGDVAAITGTLLAQSTVSAADVIEFTLNLSLQVENERGQGGGGSEYDADEAFKHVFDEYTVDDQYLAQYNVYVVEATDAQNNMISLEFNVAEGAQELPAGVYTIDDSYAPNTVSLGYIDDYIYGSFAGSLDAEGYINVPLWLLVDGTVTILENGVILVNAVNTKGAVIECRLGQWPEGIENTNEEVKAVKAIRNGQLIILKNGVEYNAQGAMVK